MPINWEFAAPAFPAFDEVSVGSNTRVLALVPHDEDVVVGCGGTLCEFGKRGAHVKVVYLTGYAHGETGSGRTRLFKMDRSEVEGRLRSLRCFESEIVHPGMKGVRCDKKSLDSVRSILSQYEPDILFVPCFDESRPEYLRTAATAAYALDGYARDVECYCYAFGGVSRPNALVDISDVIEDKIVAFHERRGTHSIAEDGEMLRKMHQYRLSSVQSDDRYCECFHRFPKETYIELARELGLMDRIQDL